MAGYLQADAFRTVVMHTPLIAIDLVVLNEHGQVLLGERLNRPAQGYWFTPGGRVRKNESLEQAFRRISHSELGVQLLMANATFRGVYEHFYRDSYFSADEHDSGTHYVVLAYTLLLADSALESLPREQHAEYRWVDVRTTSLRVHQHVLDYFDQG
ncbi:GDP-mannose mannosyl hydrolase [Pseudomonas sp. 2835]|uniref:GDP-mannose mannosyl hydrolase n=1 Tax=Pseudomonas sp. 2835 TaxID=3156451 RepID=UPI003D1BB11F